MHSRPLLDYLMEASDPADRDVPRDNTPTDSMVSRLRQLEAKLAAQKVEPEERQDLTLSAQVEAILKRKAASANPQSSEHLPAEPPPARRAVIEPPPTQPQSPADNEVRDAEFLKFTEAVYLIGQAARRFIDQPTASVPHAQPAPAAPATGDIDALAAVLRETVSAFRSVADDLAVSAGEIRNYATHRPSRMDDYREPRRLSRDDEEIEDLRDTVADLQRRLDSFAGSRRRARY